VPGDVYQRIQNLESRILQLESISPEYFDMMVWFTFYSTLLHNFLIGLLRICQIEHWTTTPVAPACSDFWGSSISNPCDI